MQQFDINQQSGYDRAKTIFSPDGRLYQVEYAREAVNMGATSLGLVFEGGIILAARRTIAKLQAVNPEKVFKIEDHVGVATAGLVSDARVIVDAARMQAQRNLLLYDEPISVYSLTKFIADAKQAYTQYGGVRPYGISMLIGGVADVPRLFHTDPSGVLKEWKAVAIGRGEDKANKVFEKEYKEGLKEDAAIKLALKALKASEENLVSQDIELAVIPHKDGMRFLSIEDVQKLISK